MALLAYCLSSIAMTVMNKAVLSSASKNPENAFKMNFMLLLCQSIACVLLLRVCKGFKLLQYRDLNQRDSLAWLPVSLMLVAMIYTGSKR